MGLVTAMSATGLADAQRAPTTCRCGHCRAVIGVPAESRRIRCPECGRSNAIPGHVQAVCERCDTKQRIRFSKRDDQHFCVNCSLSFHLREVELAVQQRRAHVHGSRAHVSRRDSAACTILLYAAALFMVLLWLIQH